LTSVRLTVSPDAVEDLQPGAILIQADERQTVILENCTFEAASDSLQLVRVTAVFARGGAQVGFPAELGPHSTPYQSDADPL
jgi:hypothetical protein